MSSESHGLCLRVAYDGTRFAGYARQPGQRTVQGTLENAVARMDGGPLPVRAASRTDAGVHALGQVVAFDPRRSIPAKGWLRGLNTHLPDDVAIQDVRICARGYAPRYDALEKHYRYVVNLGEARNPVLRDRAWHLGPKFSRRGATSTADWLDVHSMQRAAAVWIGTHDFRAFRSSDDPRDNTIRTLTSIDVARAELWGADVLMIDVRGTAFLKQMVRILVGTLVEIGREAMPWETAGRLITDRRDRHHAGPTAPPGGLTLMHIALGRKAG